MRPDIVVAWPRHVDFPLWRAWLACNRAHLGRVVIAFIEQHLPEDWRWYVRHELERIGGVTTTDAPRQGDRDWRDTAVNECLDLIPVRDGRGHVWFTEPDFLIWDDDRLRRALSELGGSPIIGYREDDERWHPSCLIVRRSVVEETSRYFGPEPKDHFLAFGREAVAIAGQPSDLEDELVRGGLEDGLIGKCDFTHIGGLSRNHQLQSAGAYGEVRRPEEHATYLQACLDRARCHPVWVEGARDFISWAKHRG